MKNAKNERFIKCLNEAIAGADLVIVNKNMIDIAEVFDISKDVADDVVDSFAKEFADYLLRLQDGYLSNDPRVETPLWMDFRVGELINILMGREKNGMDMNAVMRQDESAEKTLELKRLFAKSQEYERSLDVFLVKLMLVSHKSHREVGQ